jgi:hypothetical protein
MKGGRPNHIEDGGRRADMAPPQADAMVDTTTMTVGGTAKSEVASGSACARSLIVVLLWTYAHFERPL